MTFAEIEKIIDEYNRILIENERLRRQIFDYEEKIISQDEQCKQAFNQGADSAWELARKIVRQPINGGYKQSEFEEIFGCGYISDIFEKYTYPEADEKVEAWERQKEEIKVGDVVEVDGRKCIVTGILTIDEDFKQYSVVTEYGSAFPVSPDLMTKTGRHIDIDSFLKQIGEE